MMLSLPYPILNTIKSHVYFLRLSFALSVMMSVASELSFSLCVGGCLCPISSNSVLVYAFFSFMNKTPKISFFDKAKTFLMIVHYTWMVPFSGGIVLGVMEGFGVWVLARCCAWSYYLLSQRHFCLHN